MSPVRAAPGFSLEILSCPSIIQAAVTNHLTHTKVLDAWWPEKVGELKETS